MSRIDVEAAVIGAGPYGLATAAHLKAAKVATKVFGDPMSFWEQNMPEGMRLRSAWVASHIAHPRNEYSLDNYASARGFARQEQMPVGEFIRYGRWFQMNAVPDVERRVVTCIERRGAGFNLHLGDGDKVAVGRIIVAMGLKDQEFKPSAFARLPRELVSHTCDHVAFDQFRGKRVAVVGRGQSACETAALLSEGGAEVDLISRGDLLWLGSEQEDGSERSDLAWKLRKMMMTRGAVGPFPLNFLAEAPALVRFLPPPLRADFNARCLRAKASGWLRTRFDEVRINAGRDVRAARTVNNGVELELDTGTRVFDHVILGTGYKIDIAKLGIFEHSLLGDIVTANGSPRLSFGMESSVPGIHFVGASAVHSFGPLMRFVCGAGFAARSLAKAVAANRASMTLQAPACTETTLKKKRGRASLPAPSSAMNGIKRNALPPANRGLADGNVRGALVVGGELGAIAVIRSLGRRGLPVCLLIHDHPIPSYSRYVSRTITWPGPEAADALAFLLDVIRQHQMEGWVLFVCGDRELRFASQNYARLASVLEPTFSPWDAARWAYDKHLTYQRAEEIGLAVPKCYRPRGRHDIAQLDCRFPVILKPTVREQRNAFTRAKAWRVDDLAGLVARYHDAAALVGENNIVLQEMIPGGGAQQFSFAAVCQNGVSLGSLVARRTRQYPVDFGYTSTCVETIDAPDVEIAGRRMIKAMQLTGLVEVEFKLDRRDGCLKLLDVNARVWTWIGLGPLAGVDFSWMAWQLACGQAVAPATARPGATWVHTPRDVVAAVHEMLATRRSPISYLRSCKPPITFAAFAIDDPLPACVELPLVTQRVLSRHFASWLELLRHGQLRLFRRV